MKKQDGKSIIIWIIGIIILTFIAIFAFDFFEKGLNIKKQEDIKTEMLQVQAKSKIILERYHVDNNNALKGEKVEDTSLEEKFGIDNIQNYYKWTKDVLIEVGLNNIILEDNEYYLINYDLEEVIYSNGYKTEDGNIFYKLSDIKEQN